VAGLLVAAGAADAVLVTAGLAGRVGTVTVFVAAGAVGLTGAVGAVVAAGWPAGAQAASVNRIRIRTPRKGLIIELRIDFLRNNASIVSKKKG
jgi:hypothetical protein